MANKTIAKYVSVAVLSLGLFTVSCDKWAAINLGHEMFGRTLHAVDIEISSLCIDGEINEKDCNEIKIRLENVKALHEKADRLLINVKNIAEKTGKEPDMDAYMELASGSMEALDNIYDFVRLCGFALETKK